VVIWKAVLVEEAGHCAQGLVQVVMARDYEEMVKLFKEYGRRHTGT
jgi:hypothetical protein